MAALLLLLPWGTLAAQDTTTPDDGTDLYSTLIEALEDDQARERLLEALRSERDAAAEADAPPPEEETVPLVRRVAELTQALAEGTVEEIRTLTATVADIGERLRDIDPAAFGAATLDLAVLIAFTAVVFLLLRRVGRPLFARLDQWALDAPARYRLLRSLPAVLLAAAIDLLAVILAWVAGYGLALFVLGETGEMLTRHSLFLNAFLLIEVTRAALRLIFAVRYHGLRLLPIGGYEAAYWSAWLARLVIYIGYGLLLLVPLTTVHVSSEAGRSLGLLVMLTAFLYAAVVILQNRRRVHDRLKVTAERSEFAFTRIATSMLAVTWHWIALFYFLALAVVSITRPEDALPFMARATGQTLLAAFVGAFVARLLTQIIGRRIQVPDETRKRFPLLEERLNSYIPKALQVMRLVILLVVLAVVLDAWRVFNLGAWIASDTGTTLLGTLISVALIVTVTAAVWLVFASWVEHRLTPGASTHVPGAREQTLLTIFRNAVAIALLIITTMIVLAELGMNIGPLLAGAGVIGLAIGFGSQKLVQDIITGVFIQLENAFNVGDVVSVAGTTGVVDKLTIRSLSLRDLNGTYHLIPFSAVDNVANFTRDFAFHLGEYGVAYREDTDEVIQRLREAFEELRQDPELGPNILEDLEVHGVTGFGDSEVKVRVRIKTLPGAQWATGRAYNRLVKRHFDAAGIEIPFPHRTLYFGEDKDGSSPAANLRLFRAPESEDTATGTPRAQPDPGRQDDRD